MQAEIFYKKMGSQIATDKVWPLILLTEAQLNTLSVFEKNCLSAQQFKGCLGDVGVIYDREGAVYKVYIGAEKSSDASAIKSTVCRLPIGKYTIESTLSNQAMVAWSLAQYGFDHYKPSTIEPRVLMIEEHRLPDLLSECAAVFLVRDLINMPTNAMGPDALADVMATIAKASGAELTQWVGDELLSNNFPAIHAVGRAASIAPRLISLTWGDERHPRVTLVGKGVCFDSGGLDIKPSSGMRWMKKDMGGAAQVIGLAQWLMAKRLPIRLQVLVPAVENAISAESYRPGDVLTMRNGLNVEIDNTDAEGRLILADALVKACEDKPELLINFATLTGAARVAVGTEISAMFTNDDELSQAMLEASVYAADPVWRMPLFEGYADMLNSKIADLANSSGSSYAGAITAALFLQRFVDPLVSWAHFDIMAWNVTSKPGKPEGGEAMGMQAVGRYLMQRYG